MRKSFLLICCFYVICIQAYNFPYKQITGLDGAVGTDSVPELPLPSVPASLQTPSERASYIIVHFWDAMDFNDTLRSYNILFMEQNFSNFISVFPHADEGARSTAVATLMQKAESNNGAYSILIDITEKYLYNLDSPIYSEDYYLLFLRQILDSHRMSNDSHRMRLQFRWNVLNKNRPNTTATDFAYTSRNGINATLHTTPTEHRLLLLFYDPDCEHCREVMGELQENRALADAVASGKLQVLAVYSGEDHDLWVRTAPSLPQEWVVGYEAGMLQENDLYVIRTLPTLYLLDANKQVLFKDISITSLPDILADK